MNKLREAAEMALDALESCCVLCDDFHHSRADRHEYGEECKPEARFNAAILALRQALAAKDECETCAAKRKRLTDAGLLKSPLRGIDAIDTSESYVDENEKREHEPVAWCELNGNGEIAYFDGKPMVMPGKVGNDCHPVPLYTAPPPTTQEPVGTVLNVQWMSSAGGWEIGFHSKRKLFKGEALYTAPQEQGCAECGKKASDGWALYCVKCSETWDTSDMAHRAGGLSVEQGVDCGEAGHDEKRCGNSRCITKPTAPPSKQEQAETQEPYAYIYETNGAFGVHQSLRNESYNGRYPDKTIPVYTATPKLQGLTRDEAEKQAPVDWDALITDIETIDCRYRGDPSYDYDPYVIRDQAVKTVRRHAEYYASPPKRQWQSLTDEDIKEGAKASWVDYQAFQSVAWWADEVLKEKNT